MYLASLYLTLDVEPDVSPSDRERLLRALREKLKQKLNQRVTVRTDEEACAIVMAFFEKNYESCRLRIESMQEFIDSMGEARISYAKGQIFSFFDGKFAEVKDHIDPLFSHSDIYTSAQKNKRSSFQKIEQTIVYTDKDEDSGLLNSSRFSRKQIRIPTRK